MRIASLILAENDTVAWVAIGMDAAITVVLFIIGRAVNAHSREKRESKETIDALQARLHDAAVKHIDERFLAISHEVKSHAQGLVSTMDSVVKTVDEIKLRLQDGDGQFVDLAQTDLKHEIKAIERNKDLKDWMWEKLVTKDDMREHQVSDTRAFAKVEQGMTDLGLKVAIIGERTNHGKAGQGK